MFTHVIASSSVQSTLRFDFQPEEITQAVSALIAKERALLDEIAAVEAPTFANVVAPIHHMENEHDAAYLVIEFLCKVSPHERVRKAAIKASMAEREFTVQCSARTDIYQAICMVRDNAEEMSRLEEEDRRLVERMVRDYQRAGADLNQQQKFQVACIEEELIRLESTYRRNISQLQKYTFFSRSELEGMPDAFFADRPTQETKGTVHYRVTTKHHDYLAIMKNARHESTRKAMFVLSGARCPDNAQILQNIVKLHAEKAQLLGFPTYAAYVLDDTMAKAPQAVMRMHESIRARIGSRQVSDMAKLAQLKKADQNKDGVADHGFFRWDVLYYKTQSTAALQASDAAGDVQLRFVVLECVPKIIHILAELLGLKAAQAIAPLVWHPSVQLYGFWDKGGEFIGHIYLDLYARAKKYPHALASQLCPGFQRQDGTRQYPVTAVMASFAQPSEQAIMTLGDVQTLMHELGHAFHNLCSRTKWARFHGTQVEADFVEVPSQTMASLATAPWFLSQISPRDTSGALVPQDKLASHGKSLADYPSMLQVFHSMYGLDIESSPDGHVDVKDSYNRGIEETVLVGGGDTDTFSAGTYPHFLRGAQQYRYIWSKMLSDEMVAQCFGSADMGSAMGAGADFRAEILEPGGSRHPLIGVKNFLGREPAYYQVLSDNNE